MSKRTGRTPALATAQMSPFGVRLDGELQRLGYATKGEVERVGRMFRPDLFQALSEKSQRNWMKAGGSEPSLGAADVLDVLGVDLRYCRYGVRGDRPRITAGHGFVWSRIASTFGESVVTVPVLWRAPETLHMAKTCPRDTAVSLTGVLLAFGECMRLRSLQSGLRPVRAWTFSDQSTFRPVATDNELATLAVWFSVWARDFAVPVQIDAGVLAGLEIVAFSLSCIQPAARWISAAA